MWLRFVDSASSLLIGSSVLIFPVPAAMSSALKYNDKGQLIWVQNFNWFIEHEFFIIIARVTDGFKKMLAHIFFGDIMLDSTQRNPDKQ